MISEGEIISVAGCYDVVNRKALLPIGDTSLLMLFFGSSGCFLFVLHVPSMSTKKTRMCCGMVNLW
jgi:hypothetical protein